MFAVLIILRIPLGGWRQAVPGSSLRGDWDKKTTGVSPLWSNVGVLYHSSGPGATGHAAGGGDGGCGGSRSGSARFARARV